MKKNLYTFMFCFLMVTSIKAQQTFTNFQNASMVIGQANFTSNSTATSSTITDGPSSCAISSQGILAVAEQSGASIKIWNTLPTVNGQASDVQLAFSGGANGIAFSPDGTKLIVAGTGNQISIWNTIPTVNNQAPDVTITIYNQGPQGILVSPDGKLLIAERSAHRILVWNSIPTANNTVADYVIGQPDMVTTTSGNAADKLNSPWGIALSPDGKLLIADESNNRVVVYDSIPATFGDAATVVIGQPAFGMGGSSTTATGLNIPVGVTVTVDGKVAISEFNNHRVSIWDSVPVSNGEASTVILGQPNPTSNTNFNPSGSPTVNNMSNPYTISSDINGRLFLCGRGMNRVMVFGDLPTESAELSISITESSTAFCALSNISYSIKIENLGPDSAKNVVSTASFPVGFTIVSSVPSVGTYNSGSGYWNIPSIASGDSVTLLISGSVNSGLAGQTITSYANIISSSALDINLSNNGTNVSTTILAQAAPAAPTASGVTIPFNTTAALSATGAGTLSWYANSGSAISVATGTTYTTPSLTVSTTYYVEANDGCPSVTRTPVVVTVTPVGIDENSFKANASIYPNPTTGLVVVNFGQTLNAGSIIVSDVTGKQMFNKQNINSESLTLNLNDFSNGIYFVKIQNDNQQKVIKLIKQ